MKETEANRVPQIQCSGEPLRENLRRYQNQRRYERVRAEFRSASTSRSVKDPKAENPRYWHTGSCPISGKKGGGQVRRYHDPSRKGMYRLGTTQFQAQQAIPNMRFAQPVREEGG